MFCFQPSRGRRGIVLIVVMVVIVMISLAGFGFVATMSAKQKRASSWRTNSDGTCDRFRGRISETLFATPASHRLAAAASGRCIIIVVIIVVIVVIAGVITGANRSG